MQILNVDNPNANTNVIACMQAKDNHENLRAITKIHKDQIECLSSQTWKNKRFHLFIFGDYAFLASLYGLSGTKGTYCCLWCHIQQKELQVPLNQSKKYINIESKRTVFKEKAEKHKKHHHDFKANGKGKLSVVSSYKNCIHEPLLDINISHVCPPYLHILLGIVKKHNDLLEEKVHEVEIQIAEEISLSRVKLNNTLYIPQLYSRLEDI